MEQIDKYTLTQGRLLSIVSLSFEEDDKWILTDGNAIMNVKITDQMFLEKVNEGTSFSKGDILEVLLTIKPYLDHGCLKTEYEVVLVIRHIGRALLSLLNDPD